ncbi:hypothetical protein K9B35_05610 [Sphingomonas sp. R647]|uniref:hypothetical protein n=1 Tax=Sphingomonas sp. R647 TaxID=2875233 RepID=UPI001CD20E59|nr:hypothetical protein [Sphingomonas sp. R647]MCA1197436.1 hypothetical protein [Sphingomonas sp. R647]
MKDPLGFFDVVEVIRSIQREKDQRVAGKTGYVAGLAFDNPGDPILGYGVWMYEDERVWSFDRSDLKYLGYKDEIAEAESKRQSPSIRVSPDGNVL